MSTLDQTTTAIYNIADKIRETTDCDWTTDRDDNTVLINGEWKVVIAADRADDDENDWDLTWTVWDHNDADDVWEPFTTDGAETADVNVETVATELGRFLTD